MVAKVPHHHPNLLFLGSGLPLLPQLTAPGLGPCPLLQPLPALGTDTNEQRMDGKGSGDAEGK